MHALTYGRDETIFEAAGKQELSWTQGRRQQTQSCLRCRKPARQRDRDATGLARFDLDLVGFGSQGADRQTSAVPYPPQRNDFDFASRRIADVRGTLLKLDDRVGGRLHGHGDGGAGFSGAMRGGRQDWGRRSIGARRAARPD